MSRKKLRLVPTGKNKFSDEEIEILAWNYDGEGTALAAFKNGSLLTISSEDLPKFIASFQIDKSKKTDEE